MRSNAFFEFRAFGGSAARVLLLVGKHRRGTYATIVATASSTAARGARSTRGGARSVVCSNLRARCDQRPRACVAPRSSRPSQQPGHPRRVLATAPAQCQPRTDDPARRTNSTTHWTKSGSSEPRELPPQRRRALRRRPGLDGLLARRRGGHSSVSTRSVRTTTLCRSSRRRSRTR